MRRLVAKMSSVRCPKPGETGRPIALPSVQAPGDWSHKVPSGFNFSSAVLSFGLSDAGCPEDAECKLGPCAQAIEVCLVSRSLASCPLAPWFSWALPTMMEVRSREASWSVLAEDASRWKAWKTGLSQAVQDRATVPRHSWRKVGSGAAWWSNSMWAATAEEKTGIRSEIWPPCKGRVPLVQWLRKVEAWIQHWNFDAPFWTKRGTRHPPRRKRSRSSIVNDHGMRRWLRDGGSHVGP